MLTKEECEKVVERLYQNGYVNLIDCDIVAELIKEHFELVEKHNTLLTRSNALVNFTEEHFELVKKHEMLENTYSMLCEDYLNPQPYKFEDLKVGMWVYDVASDDCKQIAKINEYNGIYWFGVYSEYEADKFEENRFYPVQMANVRCE